MSEIRQRYSEVSTMGSTPNNNFNNAHEGRPALSGQPLSASTLLSSSPTLHGKVMKLDIPLLYSFAPTCLRRVLQYLPYPFRPCWKERYIIQIGKYLYRYEQTADEQMKLKGAPVPLQTLQSNIAKHTRRGGISDTIHSEEEIAYFQHLPSFCDGFFSVTSSGKTRYYAVMTQEDAGTWVNSLREGRQAAITHSMGHDKNMPYPVAWGYIDRMGDACVKKKMRIKRRVLKLERKEMELVDMKGGFMS